MIGPRAEVADARVLQRQSDPCRSEQAPDVVVVVGFLRQEGAVDQRVRGAREFQRDVDIGRAGAEIIRRCADAARIDQLAVGRRQSRSNLFWFVTSPSRMPPPSATANS